MPTFGKVIQGDDTVLLYSCDCSELRINKMLHRKLRRVQTFVDFHYVCVDDQL